MKVRFTLADAERAYEVWGANCGPAALAAIMGLTLDEVRPHMGDFESKRYTNPTLMFESLGRLHRDGICAGWRRVDKVWPEFGLVRIQWEGPWTAPGVPERVAYRQTHWVGAAHVRGERGVFDINCVSSAHCNGWVTLKDWDQFAVPFILKNSVPGADGKWRITHSIEIDQRLGEQHR